MSAGLTPASVRSVCNASSCVVISRGLRAEGGWCPSGCESRDGLGARDDARVRVRLCAHENRGLGEGPAGKFCKLGEGEGGREGERGLVGRPLREAEEGEPAT
jgi:hypothetical protein